jgi:nucleoside-diphosphate-sugar epimerase
VVAREFCAAGAEVTTLTRNPHTAAQLRSAELAVIEADLANSDWHEKLRGRFEVVVNTVSAGGRGLEGYNRSYVEGMRSLLAWSAKVELATLVYTSSTSVYPQGGGRRVDEMADASGAGERGALVRQSELVLIEGARDAGVGRWFVLRLAGIYGPERHHLLDQVEAGEVIGPWDQHLNLIHRDDAAGAILACAGAAREIRDRVYNVSDGHPATKREVVEWLAAHRGLPSPREGGARPTSSPFAGVGSARATPDRVIASEAISRELGWRPRYPTFREGYASFLSRRAPEPR